MTDKPCIDCGESFPVSTDHFRRRKDGKWDTRCLVCRAKKNRGKRAKEKAKDTSDIEKGALNQFISAASRGGANIPHSSELLERVMEYFGGTNGFAALMVKQYFDAPPGGAHRTKLLEGIVRLVTKNTELGGAKKPLDQWSDEELEAELDDRLKQIAISIEGRFLNVQVSPPATPSDFAATFGQAIGHLPAERIAGTPSGGGEPADRSVADVPAHTAAGGDAQVQGE